MACCILVGLAIALALSGWRVLASLFVRRADPLDWRPGRDER